MSKLPIPSAAGAPTPRCTISLKTKRWYFLRRRSRLALTLGRKALSTDPGLREAARILFGEKTEAELARYFGYRR